jgi:Flp pilus assembly pilin Flp
MTVLHRIWHEEEGVLSFEWTLLLTLLTIGIVSGLSAARDAVIDELGDIAQAAQGIDQSYSLAGLSIDFDGDTVIDFSSNGSDFTEVAADQVFTDCGRTGPPGPAGQATVSDLDS